MQLALQDSSDLSTLSSGELCGSLEDILFFHPETGQCIFNFKSFETSDTLRVYGKAPYLYPGLTLKLRLKPQGAQAYQVQTLQIEPPAGRTQLRKFLRSVGFEGVGVHVARTLSQAFPSDFFEVLQHQPQRLEQVSGVGKKRGRRILQAWKKYSYINAFKTYLFENEAPLSWADILWPSHQEMSQNYLFQHIYKAVREHDLDFESAEAFVRRTKTPFSQPERLRSALHFYLKTRYKEGHCAQPEEKFLTEVGELLTVERSDIDEALELEILNEKIVCEKIDSIAVLYLKEIWDLERRVAQLLLEFESRQPPWGWMNFPKLLNWAQDILKIELAPLQVAAIERALSNPLTVITGGPGTGKTTLIQSLVTILNTQSKVFALCSPTGRGAQRLEEATGVKARTLHRLLKYDSVQGKFKYNQKNPLNVDLVLIDEVSMVDLELMAHLLEALPSHCALILVGDADQIPPVGAGHILQSLIESDRFATVKLTEIFRQSETSWIKANAQRINQGKMPKSFDDAESDFHYLPVTGRHEIEQTVIKLMTQTLPQEFGIADFRQMQVLLPMNKGPLGTLQMNRELQAQLQRAHNLCASDWVRASEQVFRVGDKVMVTKNDYRKEVFNGDIGFIIKIDHLQQYVEVRFDDRSMSFFFEELDLLSLAYAISIHKSQGSEYRAVIVVLAEEHLPLLQRQHLYTAVTRAKEQVFLVAEPKALETAIQSDENNRRWQKLTELLSTH